MPVSKDELKKAIASLSEAVALYNRPSSTESERSAFRDACIQRFEFSVELAWKTAKKQMGTSTTAPKNIIREMAQNKLIDDPVLWLEFVDARNKTSHTYDENIAKQVLDSAVKFLSEAQKLLTRL